MEDQISEIPYYKEYGVSNFLMFSLEMFSRAQKPPLLIFVNKYAIRGGE